MDNTSGQGKSATLPPEISGWNWGAFMLNWIWGIGNGTYIAFLMFVPFVNFVMPFVLGAKGNAWAWRNKQWESVEHFKRVQRKWTIASLVALALFIVVIVVAVLGGMMAMKNSDAYKEAVARLNADQAAMAALGAPVSTGFPSGSISTSGPKGKADLSFSVTGSKAKGTLYVDAVQDMGKWVFEKLELEVEGLPARINLNQSPAAAAPAAPAAPAAAAATGPRFGKVVVSDKKESGDSLETLKASTSKIYVIAQLIDVPVGSKVKSVWILVSSKGHPPNTPVATVEGPIPEPVKQFTFNVTGPDEGWPEGEYKVELSIDGKKLADTKFAIE